MLTLPEFKNRYGEQIADYNMTEAEISACYNTYCEDPEVFNKDMMYPDRSVKVISQGAPYIERDMEKYSAKVPFVSTMRVISPLEADCD